MAKCCAQWRILKPPGSLQLTILRRLFWCNSYFMSIGVSIPCRISYYVFSYVCVRFSGMITSVGERGLSFSYNYMYMVSVQKGLLFLLMLGKGCVILLWHSLGIPCDYLEPYSRQHYSSRKHLRTKVTPDFHLTYRKNGGNVGSESK